MVIANAAALERSLYLLAELLALPVRVVVGLNMMDVARREGIEVEPHVLAAALGVPVVPLVASRNQGVAELIAAAEALALAPEQFRPARPEVTTRHRDVLERVRAVLGTSVPLPYDRDWIALKLLEGDTEVTAMARTWVPAPAWGSLSELLAQHEHAGVDIASGRYEWIGRMVRAAVTRPRLGQISLTDRLDRVATHPFWGLLLLLAVFGVTFWITFTVASPLQVWLETGVVAPLQRAVHAAFAGSPSWVGGLLAEGVVGGAGIVVTFAPILIVFFTVLALLEDTGYLARTGYLMDRVMHVVGLHGKSFLPLFLGFGCNVPAVLGARVIESPSRRLLTILLAPMVPCSGRLTVVAFLAPVFFGPRALVLALGLVALNLTVLMLVGLVLSRTVFRGQRDPFIMELPLYHVPNLRTIGMYVWNKTAAFLHGAGTVILVMAIIVWALASFPGPSLETSYLAGVGRFLTPLGELMGMDWRMLVALLGGFIARENVIATLSILYRGGESARGLAAGLAASVSPAAALAFLTVTMLFIPCAATVAVMRQETRSWRWTLFSVGLSLVVAVGGGIVVYHGARWLGV